MKKVLQWLKENIDADLYEYLERENNYERPNKKRYKRLFYTKRIYL